MTMNDVNRSAEDLLQELQSIDESHRIEAKRCTQIDRSVMETVCAFANEPGLGGGYLLLGVVRDLHDLFGTAYDVVGVSNPDKLQSDLASQCASVFNRPLRPRVSVESLQGKAVIVVYVPEAAPTDKPIYLSNRGCLGVLSGVSGRRTRRAARTTSSPCTPGIRPTPSMGPS